MANTDRYMVRNEPIEPRRLTVADLVEQCRLHGIPMDAVITGVNGIVSIIRHPDGSHDIRLGNID